MSRSRSSLLVALLTPLACSPETDLMGAAPRSADAGVASPALLLVEPAPGAVAPQILAAGEASTLFDLSTRLPKLPPGAAGELVVRAVDWAGNRAQSGPVPMTIPPAAVPIAITEVLPNPAGPEATQEFVELRNLGLEPVSLQGMSIEDATGADPLPAMTLEP